MPRPLSSAPISSGTVAQKPVRADACSVSGCTLGEHRPASYIRGTISLQGPFPRYARRPHSQSHCRRARRAHHSVRPTPSAPWPSRCAIAGAAGSSEAPSCGPRPPPKNILLIGPTGCGKTEIALRPPPTGRLRRSSRSKRPSTPRSAISTARRADHPRPRRGIRAP